ncbi:MAG: hypothetical protein SGILL_000700 [Bacillariaceae sp.]
MFFALLAEDFMVASQARLENDIDVLLGLSKTVTGFHEYEQEEQEVQGRNTLTSGFVTTPHVDEHFGVALNTTDASIVGYLPRVVQANHQAWIDYSVANQDWILDANSASGGLEPIPDYIWEMEDSVIPPGTRSELSPIWQFVPPPPVDDTGSLNFNMMSVSGFEMGRDFNSRTRLATLLQTQDFSKFFGKEKSGEGPETAILHPVMEALDDNTLIIGDLMAVLPWTTFFQNVFSSTTSPMHTVVSNTCNQVMTFLIEGPNATFIGDGDLHDSKYNYMREEALFGGFANSHALLPTEFNTSQHCVYSQTLYPTSQFEKNEQTGQPFFMALAIVAVACFTVVGFIAFDYMVTKRQKELMKTAQKQHAIVSSLFPRSIHKQLMEEVEQEVKLGKGKLSSLGKAGLRDYLNEEGTNNEISDSKPIADLFPETTIMFADIVGFTAWSSEREPSQVFVLLEKIYREFDRIAQRRRVFKVEVVGDCYVAVCGLPDPRPNHALTMAKYSRDCLTTMKEKCLELEVELGPDTTELGIRIGLHSGPVVAGVLRGEKARSNGAYNHDAYGHVPLEDEEKRNRVAEWTVEVLARLLREMVAGREARSVQPDPRNKIEEVELSFAARREQKNVIDEVAECIVLPNYKQCQQISMDAKELDLGDKVMNELRSFVRTIASLYNTNSFHNFDHANHVVMSVNKLLNRIVAPDLDDTTEKNLHDHTYGITSDPLTQFAFCELLLFKNDQMQLLQALTMLLSSVFPDVDHSGAPNAQLVKEKAPVAALYHGKSVAEQNSFDLAWELLCEPSYKNLRDVIYVTVGELKRFRQLVVNSVMATDIVDKDLKKLRNDRWDTVFAEHEKCLNEDRAECDNSQQATILRATIVIEHLIQASDVAHTMQHWHVYRRWNEMFFKECYQAYLEGRSENDPSENWYKGEIGFFDFYIIPLAKKLKDCGVFGVSSDEYLAYAMQNRKEWEMRGEELVQGMIKAVKSSQRVP